MSLMKGAIAHRHVKWPLAMISGVRANISAH